MNAARSGGIVGAIALTATIAWLLWPRPDLLIHVRRDGTAYVTNNWGGTAPLGDTVFVGGDGARRTIRVRNDDTVNHQIAMITIPAGTQTDYKVPRGTFGGLCSAHPTKTQLTFVIR